MPGCCTGHKLHLWLQNLKQAQATDSLNSLQATRYICGYKTLETSTSYRQPQQPTSCKDFLHKPQVKEAPPCVGVR